MDADPRPLCFKCLSERAENPKLGFIFARFSDGRRRPLCYFHHEQLKREGLPRAEVRDLPSEPLVTG